MSENYCDISDTLFRADAIEILCDNASVANLVPSDKDFELLLQNISAMNKDGYEMPAFGVSIDKLTKNEIQKGVWLRFYYNSGCTHNEMPFDELMIKIQPKDCGYNIIRGNSGVYDGRCFYYNLNKGDMSLLYNHIKENYISQ
ncbi:MAG: hypothetical protein K2I79_00125 [Clostridia bacterium]|nr:hypothetical protein [Clostridia bacterium]